MAHQVLGTPGIERARVACDRHGLAGSWALATKNADQVILTDLVICAASAFGDLTVKSCVTSCEECRDIHIAFSRI